jgi:hypothetical protein
MVETSHPLKDRLSNKMLRIWNGNHNLKTWTSYIKYNHINNIKWHFNVNTMILDGKEKNIDGLWDYLVGDSCSKNLLHLSPCTQHQKIRCDRLAT